MSFTAHSEKTWSLKCFSDVLQAHKLAALKAEYADVLGGAPPGLPPDRDMELVIETGEAPMPRSSPVKRLSEGELAELRTQLVDRLDRG